MLGVVAQELNSWVALEPGLLNPKCNVNLDKYLSEKLTRILQDLVRFLWKES